MKVHSIDGQGFSGNIFLIEADKPCLVDAGWSPNIRRASEKVRDILDGRTLENIILTHRHIDHVGGAMAFHRAFGGVLLAHEEDAGALKSGDPESTGALLFGGSIEPMPVEVIHGGDSIDLGGGERLEVVHTPGHTSGSICLLGNGSLFSGDTVFADGGIGRWDLETGDYDMLLSSIEKLSGLDYDNMYPGHGPAVMGSAKDHVMLSLRQMRLIGRYG